MKELVFSWFDIFVVAMVIAGVFVGRKRGMSTELLDLVKWLLVVGLGGFLHRSFGAFLEDVLGTGLTLSYTLAYLLIAGTIFLVFAVIKRTSGEKIVSADCFGRLEYYLGMGSGAVRFLCMVVFGLALLNAKPVSDQDLAAQIRAQNESLGAIYFPPMGSIQRSVFDHSFSGRLARDYLSGQLIVVQQSSSGVHRRQTLGRWREQQVEEVIGR